MGGGVCRDFVYALSRWEEASDVGSISAQPNEGVGNNLKKYTTCKEIYEILEMINYFWVVLFNCDVEQERPFQIFVRSIFEKKGKNCDWINGGINRQFRLLIRSLPPLEGKFRIFALIEKGNNK